MGDKQCLVQLRGTKQAGQGTEFLNRNVRFSARGYSVKRQVCEVSQNGGLSVWYDDHADEVIGRYESPDPEKVNDWL